MKLYSKNINLTTKLKSRTKCITLWKITCKYAITVGKQSTISYVNVNKNYHAKKLSTILSTRF